MMEHTPRPTYTAEGATIRDMDSLDGGADEEVICACGYLATDAKAGAVHLPALRCGHGPTELEAAAERLAAEWSARAAIAAAEKAGA